MPALMGTGAPGAAVMPFIPKGGMQVGPSTGALPTPLKAVAPAAAGVAAHGPSGAVGNPTGPNPGTGFAPTGTVAPAPTGLSPLSSGAAGNPNGPTPGFTPGGVTPTVQPNGSAPTVTPSGPNYAQDIQGMPGYISAENAAANANTNAGIGRQQAIDSALQQYGGPLPPGFQDKYGDITSTDLSAAAANPYSGAAQQDRANAQAIEGIKQSVGTAGGALQIGYNNQANANGLDMYNLANAFLNSAGGAVQSYLGTVNTDAGNVANATLAAEQTASQNPGYWPSGSATPTTTAPMTTPPAGYSAGEPGNPSFRPTPLPQTPSTVGPVQPSYMPLTPAQVVDRNRRQAA
jgi:hypothetical protein